MAEKEPPGPGPEGDDTHPPDEFEAASDQAETSPGDSTPSTDQPAEPKKLGDFELLREIGRGGMGIVYEARQLSLNRRVALKVLPPGLGLTEEGIRRFEREARAAAKLHHTNIVPVHATGEEEGCHYYAMELVEGQPLSRVLDDLRGDGSSSLLAETMTHMTAGTSSPSVDSHEGITSSGPTDTSA